MEKARIQRQENSRTIQQRNAGSANIVDNRQHFLSGTSLQRVEDDEEDVAQGKMEHTAQRVEGEEDDEVLQGKMGDAAPKNETGLPDNLKAGVESLSGFSLDNVRVHYNSSKPATVQALAYTQGTDIHVAPGQEQHLPHEAWHVAQQMAGRVAPTTNINGMPVNDNAALEHEADVMGEKAVQCKATGGKSLLIKKSKSHSALQRRCYLGKRSLLVGFSASSGDSDSSRQGGSSLGSSNASTSISALSSAGSSSSIIGSDYSSRTSHSSGSSGSELGSKHIISSHNLEYESSTGPHKADPVKKAVYLSKVKSKVNADNVASYDSETKIGKKESYGLTDLGFFHAHFWFNHRYLLPYGNKTKKTEGEWGNNIGYGGTLYSDPSGPSNYDLTGPISETPEVINHKESVGNLNDYQIVEAMWQLSEEWTGGYNILTHNCQHWAHKVINKAQKIPKEEAERAFIPFEPKRMELRGQQQRNEGDSTTGPLQLASLSDRGNVANDSVSRPLNNNTAQLYALKNGRFTFTPQTLRDLVACMKMNPRIVTADGFSSKAVLTNLSHYVYDDEMDISGMTSMDEIMRAVRGTTIGERDIVQTVGGVQFVFPASLQKKTGGLFFRFRDAMDYTDFAKAEGQAGIKRITDGGYELKIKRSGYRLFGHYVDGKKQFVFDRMADEHK